MTDIKRVTIIPVDASGPWVQSTAPGRVTMAAGTVIRTVDEEAGGCARLVEHGTMWQVCVHDGAPVEWYTVSQVRQVVVEEV